MQQYYPLQPSGGFGAISNVEYNLILQYMGREKLWAAPESGTWKNPHSRYCCFFLFFLLIVAMSNVVLKFDTRRMDQQPKLKPKSSLKMLLTYCMLYPLFANAKKIKMCRYDVADVLYQETLQYFSDMFNTPKSFTFLTLDDDVVRASSKANASRGYPITRIPNRKLGINVDGLGDPISGVLLGGYIDRYDSTLDDVVKSILLQLSKHTSMDALLKDPDLQHLLLMFDRGYYEESKVEVITDAGANTGGTLKRSWSIPVTYGDSKPVAGQTYVEKKGKTKSQSCFHVTFTLQSSEQ